MFLFGLLPFMLLIVVVVVVVALLAGRSEPDPERERPAALYLSAVTIIGTLVFLGALFATVTGFVNFTDSSDNSGGWVGYSFGGQSDTSSGSSLDAVPAPFPPDASPTFVPPGKLPPGYQGGPGGPFVPTTRVPSRAPLMHHSHANHDDDVSMIVDGLIAGALAAGVVTFHGRRLREFGSKSSGPGVRVYARHLYLACFATMLVALVAGGIALHSVFGMITPDTAGVGTRADAFRTLVPTGILSLVALTMLRANWRRSEALSGPRPAPPVAQPATPPA